MRPTCQARTKTWLKTKSVMVGDFPIVGYTASAAAGGLGALALGEWVDGELEYRGKVGTGFDARPWRCCSSGSKPLRPVRTSSRARPRM
jgi:bifunctional non-homologous end joining protein LigD